MKRRALAALWAVLLALPAAAGRAAELGPPPAPVAIPPRPEGAISGSEFARRTTGMPGRERQTRALEELTGGNLPDFLRRLQPVRLRFETGAGVREIDLWVMPDYLAIGSEDDFLRIPLTQPSAVTIARRFGFVLPTRKLVDEIYERAAVKLDPRPLPPGPKMRSSAYYMQHQRIIEEQLAGLPRGGLVAGHKKDVVLSNRLRTRPDRIAIYGWHRETGDAIQPLSTIHGARYADYSHGLRLVWATAWVDGSPRPVLELLDDPLLAPALTYEGEIDRPGELMKWPRE